MVTIVVGIRDTQTQNGLLEQRKAGLDSVVSICKAPGVTTAQKNILSSTSVITRLKIPNLYYQEICEKQQQQTGCWPTIIRKAIYYIKGV